jgi:phosphoribosylanthranilate isomerase
MTWIKICGTTNLEDALTAVDAGADALGFVFYEKSPRRVDPERAREIVAKLPDAIEKVGVFVDQTAEEVHEIVDRVGLTAVQLYQKECAEGFNDLQELDPSTMRRRAKIVFVIPGDQFADSGGVHLRSGFWGISKGFKDTLFAFLVDSSSATQPGGTGQRFEWIRVRGLFPTLGSICPTIVAGGLEPSNVGIAMTLLRPWGVDVVSGVEASPGKKDPEKVRAFIAAVRQAEKSI